jgi:hypothetical protein
MLLAFPIAKAAASDLTLVRDGQSRAVVILSPTATEDEKLAAAELCAYLRKISGATISITTEPPKNFAAIRIATYAAALATGWRGARPAVEGFTLDAEPDTLWIVGADARGALNGVYRIAGDARCAMVHARRTRRGRALTSHNKNTCYTSPASHR